MKTFMSWKVTFIVSSEVSHRPSHSKKKEHFSKTTRIDLITTVSFTHMCAHNQSSEDQSTYDKSSMTLLLTNEGKLQKVTNPSLDFQCKVHG